MISGKNRKSAFCCLHELTGKRLFVASVFLVALFTLGCEPKPTENAAPSGNNVLAVDGSVLQNAKDMHVYYIFDGKKHYIPNPPTLEILGLSKQVRVVPDDQVNAIPLGDQVPVLTSNVMVKAGTGQVFMIEAGKRRYIPDPDTLAALHVTKEQVKYVPNAVADAIPLGTPYPHQSSKAANTAAKH